MMVLADTTDRWGDGVLDALGMLVVMVLFLWPLFWPLAVAVMRKLPRRRMFALVAAAMTMGALACFLGLLVYPVSTYLLFFAPMFQEAGLAYGHWLRAPMQALDALTYVWIPFCEIVISVVITQRMASRWRAICSALAG